MRYDKIAVLSLIDERQEQHDGVSCVSGLVEILFLFTTFDWELLYYAGNILPYVNYNW